MFLAVVFALAAALANAVNVLTQHKASIGAPKRVKGWRLALYLPRQPLWLLGVAAAVGSFVFQALALHNGPMSVVQPRQSGHRRRVVRLDGRRDHHAHQDSAPGPRSIAAGQRLSEP